MKKIILSVGLTLFIINVFAQGGIAGDKTKDERPKEGYYIPEWCQKAIWYQIFPERFRNGDTTNDPTAERIGMHEDWEITPWTHDWYAIPKAESQSKFTSQRRRGVNSRRYGGDLQGVIDKLDYLKELGITVIYFNPIFDSRSLHKYDATYYHHIDRFFGPDPEGDAAIFERENLANPEAWQWTSADKLFLDLIHQAHKKGIKIVIDGVFNHVGTDFWAFKDIVTNQQKSTFKDWFDIISWDNPETPENEFDYHGWAGYKGMPEFKEIDGNIVEPARKHIFAVSKRWMDPNNDGDPSDGVDGWRLDVAYDVGHAFWKEWHSYIRSINPEVYTTAEIWQLEVASKYVSDDQFIAVMNYPLLKAMHRFFIMKNVTAEQFDTMLAEVRKPYQQNVNQAMMNLMGSHDTERLASMIVNNNRNFKEGSKIRNQESTYITRKPNEEQIQVQKLIALFQYTYVGSPMVYYGDEAGMWGADDPDDRKPMIWSDLEYDDEITGPFGHTHTPDKVEFDQDLFNWYKKLATIRSSNVELQTGNYKTLYADNEKEVFIFARYNDKDFAIIGVNRSNSPVTVKVDVDIIKKSPDVLKDILNNTNYKVIDKSIELTLSPLNGCILIH